MILTTTLREQRFGKIVVVAERERERSIPRIGGIRLEDKSPISLSSSYPNSTEKHAAEKWQAASTNRHGVRWYEHGVLSVGGT